MQSENDSGAEEPALASPVSSPSSSQLDTSEPFGRSDSRSEHVHLPLPLSLAHQYLQYRPGELHLVPCTIEQYLALPNKAEDRYEFVEGILVWRQPDMTDAHSDIEDCFAAYLQNTFCSPESAMVVFKERQVAIKYQSTSRSSRNSSDSTTRGPIKTIRRADIVICNRETFETGRDSEFVFGVGNPPEMAVEITSTTRTRNVDLHVKKEEYELAGVELYVIIDRDLPHEGAGAEILVYKLSGTPRAHNRKYMPAEHFRDDDLVAGSIDRSHNLRALGLRARQILYPERLATDIVNSPVTRANRRASNERKEKEEAKRRASSERREKEEAKRRASSERREKEEAKRRASSERKEKEEAKRRASSERWEKEKTQKERDMALAESEELRRRLAVLENSMTTGDGGKSSHERFR